MMHYSEVQRTKNIGWYFCVYMFAIMKNITVRHTYRLYYIIKATNITVRCTYYLYYIIKATNMSLLRS